MHPHLLEREIAHLEQVIRHISRDRHPIPLRYWQGRVDRLGEFVRTESLHRRVQTLRRALAALQSYKAA